LVTEFEAKLQRGPAENTTADGAEITNEKAVPERANPDLEPPTAETHLRGNRSINDVIRDIEARTVELEQMAQPRRKGRKTQG
jgi:hypothetical protein